MAMFNSSYYNSGNYLQNRLSSPLLYSIPDNQYNLLSDNLINSRLNNDLTINRYDPTRNLNLMSSRTLNDNFNILYNDLNTYDLNSPLNLQNTSRTFKENRTESKSKSENKKPNSHEVFTNNIDRRLARKVNSDSNRNERRLPRIEKLNYNQNYRNSNEIGRSSFNKSWNSNTNVTNSINSTPKNLRKKSNSNTFLPKLDNNEVNESRESRHLKSKSKTSNMSEQVVNSSIKKTFNQSLVSNNDSRDEQRTNTSNDKSILIRGTDKQVSDATLFQKSFRNTSNNGNTDSAEIEVNTVSSMISSENHSPINTNKETNKSNVLNPQFGPKDILRISSTPKHLKELDIQFGSAEPNEDSDNDNYNNKFDNDINFYKSEFYRDNSNETIYRKETMKRIKPILVTGDVAYGKDSIKPESDEQKAEKEQKRRIYGDSVKRKLVQTPRTGNNRKNSYLSQPPLTPFELDKARKSSRYHSRKSYSRMVKDKNDNDFEKFKQKEYYKNVLSQVEKRGEDLIKEKQSKIKNVKKRNMYSDYVKERNQVLIEDQRKQRNWRIQHRNTGIVDSEAPYIDETNDDTILYSKNNKYYGNTENKYHSQSLPNKKKSYFIDLKGSQGSFHRKLKEDLENDLNDKFEINERMQNTTKNNTHNSYYNEYISNNEILRNSS